MAACTYARARTTPLWYKSAVVVQPLFSFSSSLALVYNARGQSKHGGTFALYGSGQAGRQAGRQGKREIEQGGERKVG